MTVDLGITYEINEKDLNVFYQGLNTLVAYSDADFVGCLDYAKKQNQYCMMNGCPIAWKPERQANVALSTET